MIQPGIDPEGPFALGRMRNLQRGKTPEFVGFWEELNWPSPDSALAVESEIEFQAAVGNALGVVVVNLSLSIRRAFDQVYEMRKAKGGPLWPKVAM